MRFCGETLVHSVGIPTLGPPDFVGKTMPLKQVPLLNIHNWTKYVSIPVILPIEIPVVSLPYLGYQRGKTTNLRYLRTKKGIDGTTPKRWFWGYRSLSYTSATSKFLHVVNWGMPTPWFAVGKKEIHVYEVHKNCFLTFIINV